MGGRGEPGVDEHKYISSIEHKMLYYGDFNISETIDVIGPDSEFISSGS